MKINHIIFDLDDTLCNYSQAKDNALQACFALIEAEVNMKQILQIYFSIEPVLFRLFTMGMIPKEQYQVGRFHIPLFLLGISPTDILAKQMNNLYVSMANTNISLFDDVEDGLKYLQERYRLSLLTNGPSDGQRKKINALDIGKYFHNIFISEEIGIAKPDPKAFIYVLKTLQSTPQHVVMIGDSLQNDIKPAKELGLHVYHLNRHHRPTETNSFYTLKELINKAFKQTEYDDVD